ncbi:hypothetical protein [Dyadobacter sediminis]|uniref:Collagen-like protein n=1 Tax=Dyadobacter sediminis TaxID=1493691 RepID=A0A5R9KF10_9BACT|nr:hypothetical protein [Dyadobacter sediminis]TLU94722.1 hypothetical protein FEM55_10885 [Dyadobacter sediminis]GGB88732.1 hypothetical protein GCM10011325_15320 [Dyadobacter sediminis]
MNRKLIPLLLIFLALFQGCRGPEGPQGPQGESIDVVGTTFDLVNVNFTVANQHQYGLTFADAKVNVLESDAVLVYINWGETDVNGEKLVAYRPLPQTAFLTNGILTYNFDRTSKDFSIFLDGTVNLAAVSADYTANQSFRVVIVPADFAARTNGAVNYNDYNSVAKYFNIKESEVVKIKAK